MGGRSVTRRVLCAGAASAMAVLSTRGRGRPAAAQECVGCIYYAYTDLNLRKAPGTGSAVLIVVPKGAAVQREAGAEVAGYARVTYAGVPGWVVALGLVSSPGEVEPDPAPAAAPVPAPAVTPVPSAPAADPNERVTLAGLNLRAGPSPDAEVLAAMPEGSVVTLTGEGFANGYVTVDYGGAIGWAYANLLAPPDEVG